MKYKKGCLILMHSSLLNLTKSSSYSSKFQRSSFFPQGSFWDRETRLKEFFKLASFAF